ncbi:DUF6503 family protein [Cecembia calidifontis]|uniref:Deoxyribose-phosphate aldolase n=1 Tax=Cecembia calidifontis TaxID=1187080 RepID=A0A4Q7PA35_9BACT|nr:DUF6503 family protein [Cecembia calidifontis]RZS97064.1 hypothetical protein BC751_2661 [Cecembia calidifontis]
MKIFLSFLILTIFISSCSQQGVDKEAQRIVDLAIQAHGGELFQKAVISFDFRERHYSIFKSPQRFEYIREFTDSTGFVRDVLNNEGFQRTVNGNPVELPEDRIRAFSNSVNSVAYFAFLPYGLNDAAVIKTYVGETELEGNPYHVVKVTFKQEGGGEDYDDEFLYWFHKENHMMDYMAYSYHTDGGGVRFRKAIRKHQVNGLVLLDFENYKPEDKKTPVDQMETLFKEGKLELLSEIILENIKVTF